ncbi:hypothetical protein HDV00_007968 [Rhizophlyctis rosea]|nr:hypothetical protein HDV00_007968 [Rhizophlyctis rosea]
MTIWDQEQFDRTGLGGPNPAPLNLSSFNSSYNANTGSRFTVPSRVPLQWIELLQVPWSYNSEKRIKKLFDPRDQSAFQGYRDRATQAVSPLHRNVGVLFGDPIISARLIAQRRIQYPNGTHIAVQSGAPKPPPEDPSGPFNPSQTTRPVTRGTTTVAVSKTGDEAMTRPNNRIGRREDGSNWYVEFATEAEAQAFRGTFHGISNVRVRLIEDPLGHEGGPPPHQDRRLIDALGLPVASTTTTTATTTAATTTTTTTMTTIATATTPSIPTTTATTSSSAPSVPTLIPLNLHIPTPTPILTTTPLPTALLPHTTTSLPTSSTPVPAIAPLPLVLTSTSLPPQPTLLTNEAPTQSSSATVPATPSGIEAVKSAVDAINEEGSTSPSQSNHDVPALSNGKRTRIDGDIELGGEKKRRVDGIGSDGTLVSGREVTGADITGAGSSSSLEQRKRKEREGEEDDETDDDSSASIKRPKVDV